MKSFTPHKSINITDRLLDGQDYADYRDSLNLEIRLRHLIYLLIFILIIAKILT